MRKLYFATELKAKHFSRYLLAISLMLFLGATVTGQTITQTFSTPGTYYWTVPAGVTSITVSAWGGGGAGGGTTGYTAAGGGGEGGSFVRGTINVTPGQEYKIIVGNGGSGGNSSDGGNGEHTSVVLVPTSTTIFNATGGAGGKRGVSSSTSFGAGGSSTNTGNIVSGTSQSDYYGGNGGSATGVGGIGGNRSAFSGGGGGSAGAGGNGGSGGSTDAGSAGAGLGTPSDPGAAGATGRGSTNDGNGLNGNFPGGGGSGARDANLSFYNSYSGGDGANGQVIIRHDMPIGYCYGNAVSQTNSSVTGASNALGAPNGTYATFNAPNDELVLDLLGNNNSVLLDLGGIVTAQWRKSSSNGTSPQVRVEFSSDGSSWTQVGSGSYTVASTSFTSQNFTLPINSRYVRFIITNSPNRDLHLDAVSFQTPCSLPNEISTGTIAGAPFCAGSTITVPFTSTGTFSPGNIYTAQLSNASGNFGSPVAIGTLSGTNNSGNISATIPANTPAGTGYRIRVVSNNPSVTGSNNGTNITVNHTAAPTGTTNQSFCWSENAKVSDIEITGTGIQWYTTANGGTPLGANTVLTNGSTYYASQTISGCESYDRKAVTITITNPIAPTGNANQSFCAIDNPTVSQLVANGAGIKWYAIASGGSPLAVNTPLVDGTDYYASQTIDGCEGESRLKVTVTISNTAAPTGSANQDFCTIPSPVIGDLTATGTGIKWYSSASGGTALNNSTALINGTTYYASQTTSGCESTSRLPVTVSITDPAPPSGEAVQVFCAADGSTISDLAINSTGSVQWYSAATGGTAIAPTTALVDGNYYASQTVSGCESSVRFLVAVEVRPTPTPTITGTTTVCKDEDYPNVTITNPQNLPITVVYEKDGIAQAPVNIDANSSTNISVPTGSAGEYTYSIQSAKYQAGPDCINTITGQSATVTVRPTPAATISGTNDVCLNGAAQTVTFSNPMDLPVTVTYTINSGNDQTINVAANSTATVNQGTTTSGTYIYEIQRVAYQNGPNCSAPVLDQSATVTVNPLPTATINGNTTVCQNTSGVNITFEGGNGTAPYTFTYNVDGGSDQTISTTPGNSSIDLPINTNTPGTFTYTLTSVQDGSSTSCSQPQSGNVVVVVKDPPTITTQPTSPTAVCASTNSSRTFSVTATGDDLTYQWYHDGHPISGATSATYTISNPVGADGGDYYVVVGSSGECNMITVQSQTVTFTVNDPINITTGAISQTICEDQTTTFTVNYTGSVQSMIWIKDGFGLSEGGHYSGTTTNTLTINNATEAQSGSYSLSIISNDGVCTNGTYIGASLVVNKKSAAPVSATATQPTICEGSSSVLTLNGGGGGTGEVIHWYSDAAGTVSVGTGNNITVNPSVTTTYYGRYEDGAPCNYATSFAQVTVSVDPEPVGGTASSNQIICSSSMPADISVSGITGSVIRWEWSATGIGGWATITGTNSSTLTAAQMGTLTTDRYYRAVVQSGLCGIANSNPVHITVNPLPTVESVNGGDVCGSGPVTLSASASSGAVINWYDAPSGGTLLSTGSSYAPSVTTTTTYYAEAVNSSTGCISASRTAVTATVKPVPDAAASISTQNVCSESSITPINITNPNGISGTTFAWTRTANAAVTGIGNGSGNTINGTLTSSANTAQTIVFTITPSADGCSGTPVTSTVVVNPKPTISVTSAPAAVCYNSPIAISYTNPNNVAGTTLSWTRDNPAGIQAGPATSGTGNISQSLVNTTEENIIVTYTLTATSEDGCTSTATVPIVLYAEQKAPVISTDQNVCLISTPDILTSEPAKGGNGIYTYQWERSEDLSNWSTLNNQISLTYQPQDIPLFGARTYYYRLVASSTECIPTLTSNIVTIQPFVDGEITFRNPTGYPKDPVCSGNSFTFHTEADHLVTSALRYKWSADPNYVTPASGSGAGSTSGIKWLIIIPYRTSSVDLPFSLQNNTDQPVTTTISVTPVLYDYPGPSSKPEKCASTSQNFDVTINPTPKVNDVADQVLCSGQTANINFSSPTTGGTITYHWTNSNSAIGLGASGTGNISFTKTNLGNTPITATITVYPTFKNSNGKGEECTGLSKTFTITINPEPKVDPISNQTVCNGSPITNINFDGVATEYTWTNSQTSIGLVASETGNISSFNAVNNSDVPVIATVTVTPKYNASGASCTGDSKNFQITVNPTPKVTALTVNDVTICEGASTTINIMGTPNSTVSYTVGANSTVHTASLNSGGMGSINTGTLNTTTTFNFNNIELNTSPNCAVSSLTNSITVNVRPNADADMSINGNSTICVGESAEIEFSGTPNTSLTYNDGTDHVVHLDASGNGSVTVSPSAITTYQLKNIGYTGAPGCQQDLTDKSPVTVTVNAKPTATLGGNNSSVCAGTQVNLPISFTGAAPWSFTYNDGSGNTTVNGITDNTYTLTVTPSTTSDYTLVSVNDANGCAGGAVNGAVRVDMNPDVVAGTINGTDALCIDANSTPYTVSGIANQTSTAWSVATVNGGSLTINSSSPGQVTVTPTAAGDAELIYTVEGCGGPKTAVFPITIDAASLAGTASTTPICAEDQPVLTISGNVGSVVNWQYFDGTNWQNYTNTPVSAPTQFRASVKNGACNAAFSSPVVVPVRNYWLGTVSSDWNTASNWSTNQVASLANNACPDVYVPQQTYQPILSAQTIPIGNLHVLNNAWVTVDGDNNAQGKLQIAGSIMNTGLGLEVKNKGAVEFNGSSAQTIASQNFTNTTVSNMIISNQSGVTIASTDENIAITNQLTLSQNSVLNTGDNLTLKSDANTTASLTSIPTDGSGNALATLNGEVTVERYINTGSNTSLGQHKSGWYFLATPAHGAQTIRESWMESGDVNVTGYGIWLDNPSGTANGWDANTAYTPSIKKYDYQNDNWIGAGSAHTTLYNPNGWMTYIMGDRSVRLISQNPTSTVLRSKGTLQTGKFTINVPNKADGSFAIGNPYASNVDFRLIEDLGTNPTITIWVPSDPGTVGEGGFRSFTLDNGNFTGGGAATYNTLLNGQAFFVQTNSTGYQLTFKEDSKVADNSSGREYFRPMGWFNPNGSAKLSTDLYKSDGRFVDGTQQFFGKEFSDDIDLDDGRKMLNTSNNLSISTKGTLLTVERRTPLAKADTIYYDMMSVAPGEYDFKFTTRSLNMSGMSARLIDNYTKAATPVSLDGETEVSFEVTSDQGSAARNRFMLVFDGNRKLNVAFNGIDAVKENGGVNVTWDVKDEDYVDHYIVMASADGDHYSDLATVGANGNGAYSLVDEAPQSGYNYYIIRAVGIDGGTLMSPSAKIFLGYGEPSISVFPNPVKGGAINVVLKNQPQGKYKVRLLSTQGQTIDVVNIEHAGGTITKRILWKNELAHGAYLLQVVKPGGGVETIKVVY